MKVELISKFPAIQVSKTIEIADDIVMDEEVRIQGFQEIINKLLIPKLIEKIGKTEIKNTAVIKKK